MFEPELRLGRDILAPDLAVWCPENMPDYPEAAYFETASDWVCGVHSTGTHSQDIEPKCELFARERVSHLWFVDPDVDSLEAFALKNNRKWMLLATLIGTAEVRQPPSDTFSIPSETQRPPRSADKDRESAAENDDGSKPAKGLRSRRSQSSESR